MNSRLVTAPLELPVTLRSAREHLRITVTSEDGRILALVFAATEHAENYMRRRFVTQTREWVLDGFAQRFNPTYTYIELPDAPLVSVTSVKYLDGAGAEQTLASSAYQVDTAHEFSRLLLAPDGAWPAISSRLNAVTIRYVCGYGGSAAVPFSIKAAILLHVEAHFDRDPAQTARLLKASNYLLEGAMHGGVGWRVFA